MKQLVYITGSGHSGSTLLDRLLGSHPQIAALGEVHRFSLGLHRDERPFRCDCSEAVDACPFWSEVFALVATRLGINPATLRSQFQTTDHSMLCQSSGEKYFNAQAAYRILPTQLDKYLLTLTPRALAPFLGQIGMLGGLLDYARNSHLLFDAVSDVSGASTIIDSTKNPVRMRALNLTAPHTMKVIYLRRDGRAVANSRMKRQKIGMEQAARIWVAENRKIRLMLRAIKDIEVLNVTYEVLCDSPNDEMSRIFRFLDLPEALVNLTTERHAIGGNPSRFDGDETVVSDEKWHHDLTEADLTIFEKIAGAEQNQS